MKKTIEFDISSFNMVEIIVNDQIISITKFTFVNVDFFGRMKIVDKDSITIPLTIQ